jgi:ABC-2 type transport system ATP-binding protein
VDAAFLDKARTRLVDLVKRSGLLVFASHSDEFLIELCDSAIWMDEGKVKQQGGIREVLTAYKGRDPFENLSQEQLTRLGMDAVPTDAGARA